mgnify:CR=1 FL=1
MRIGLVDLDTSHPGAWLPIIREMGHMVVGVWDGGSVHPKGYADQFARSNKIDRVYESLDEMAASVDCAILHGCNWDLRVDRARPFISSHKAVLFDKPIAGNPIHLKMLLNWADAGSIVTGGSSLRFCNEVSKWKLRPLAERGEPHTVFCGCGVDEFNYGIHAYSMMAGLMGPGIVSVRHLGEHGQRRILVKWKDGREAYVVVGEAQKYLPFYATVLTDRGVSHIEADNNHLYRALLTTTLPYLSGNTKPPVSFNELIEPELAAIAAERSRKDGGQEVLIHSLFDTDPGYDGYAFAKAYRLQKYPSR